MHAYLRIPFYKNEFDKAGVNPRDFSSLEELSSYPIINKDIIRANNLINRNAFVKYKFKSHTSGSTGQPMWTYYDFISWIRKKYLVKGKCKNRMRGKT